MNSAGWQRAAGDSMMADFNRQQAELLTASMKSLDEIRRSLDCLKTSMESLDNSSSRLTGLSEMPNREEIPSSDLDLDDLLGIKETRARIAENPTPSLYLDAGIKEEVNDNFDQAKKDYQAALELDPAYGAAMFQLAKLHLQVGELKQAEALADQCEKYDPSYANGIRKDIKAYGENNP